jgi:hypothetical protein
LLVVIVSKTSFGFGGRSDNGVLTSTYLDGDGVAVSSSDEELLDEESHIN